MGHLQLINDGFHVVSDDVKSVLSDTSGGIYYEDNVRSTVAACNFTLFIVIGSSCELMAFFLKVAPLFHLFVKSLQTYFFRNVCQSFLGDICTCIRSYHQRMFHHFGMGCSHTHWHLEKKRRRKNAISIVYNFKLKARKSLRSEMQIFQHPNETHYCKRPPRYYQWCHTELWSYWR